VESLNSCQTIVRQKKLIFPYYCIGNLVQKACGEFEILTNNCSAKKLIFSYYTGIEQTILKKNYCG
jgi:hypothetical protein